MTSPYNIISIYGMTHQQIAYLIRQLSYTLCNGDDLLIDVSNISRDSLYKHGVEEFSLSDALEEIADNLDKTHE